VAKNPIQPIVTVQGVARFKPNAIVNHLLEKGGIDLNMLAVMDFSQDDREQFAQLIGYSLSGFSELSYVSDETYSAATRMLHDGNTDHEARAKALRTQLDEVKKGMRKAVATLYGIHPDDLGR
jgi:hypothetical protein